MKYMTFNSSCSYAGLANMLSCYGVDSTDREIALGMKLPYLFSVEDGNYLAGPMLQSAAWFDLYLRPRGFRLVETMLERAAVAEFLECHQIAMLGLKISDHAKHAVIYQGKCGGKLCFLNNKWERSEEPDTLLLSQEELLLRLEERAMVAVLERTMPEKVEFSPLLEVSAHVLRRNLADIQVICREDRTVASLREQMNTLFRPLLLDGITMLELLGENALVSRFRALQGELLTALGQEGEKNIRLADWLRLPELEAATMAYLRLIEAEF